MKSVITKAALLDEVRRNREAHREQFELALEGYRLTAMRTLEARLNDLSEGRTPVVAFHHAPPEDHTPDYDRIIRLLELDQRSELELSETEFAQYVMDDWGWKQAWNVSNSEYVAAVVM